MDITKQKKIFFIGIGGAGMSALARVLLEMGYSVFGSDLKETVRTVTLRDLGAKLFFGHSESHLRSMDVVVVSSAIGEDNPEYMYAKQERLPVMRRAEMLNYIMSTFTKQIGVTGTHGKTSTSSMIVRVLESVGMAPTYMVGSDFNDYGGNASYQPGLYAVAEVDESDGSFLDVQSSTSIITNIEPEHLNFYKTEARMVDYYRQYMEKVVSGGGYLVLNRDDVTLTDLSKQFPSDKLVFFSLEEPSDVQAKHIEFLKDGIRYELFLKGVSHGLVELRVFGSHNVYNSLSIIAMSIQEGFGLDLVKKGLLNFMGTQRRLQLIGERKSILIYDDYGHHPTEIKVTLDALKKSLARRVVCIFQPHRYSRTRDFMTLFATAFDAADLVVITEVYSAFESKISGVSGKMIVDRLCEKEPGKALFISHKGEVAHQLFSQLKEGDVVVTMGAGDVYTVAKELYTRLKDPIISEG